jgi:hypothetical protein
MDLTAPVTQQNKTQMSTCFMLNQNSDSPPENITTLTAVNNCSKK